MLSFFCPYVSISVKMVYGETQNKNTFLLAVLKGKWKEEQSQVSGSLLDVCCTRAATCKASLILLAAERSDHFSAATSYQNNDEWMRSVLELQNCNNFAGC